MVWIAPRPHQQQPSVTVPGTHSSGGLANTAVTAFIRIVLSTSVPGRGTVHAHGWSVRASYRSSPPRCVHAESTHPR